MRSLVMNKNYLWLYIGAGILLMYFIYAPALNLLYHSGDDFRYSFGGLHKVCAKDDGFEFMRTLGRPLQAYIDCASFKLAYTLAGMRVLRIVTVIVIGCLMGLMTSWFVGLGLTPLIAFLTSGCLLLTEHLYGDTIPMGAISLPIAILLTLAAFIVLQKSYHARQRRGWMLLAAISLYCSMLTYPAMSFFWGTLVLSKILFRDLQHWSQTRKEVFKEIIFFGVVACAYFAWASYNMHFHPTAPVSGAYQLDHPNMSIGESLQRLLLLTNVFSDMWAISPDMNRSIQGWFMLSCIGIGALIALVTFFGSKYFLKNKTQSSAVLLQAVESALLLLVFSSGFFLMMPSLSLIENRVLFGVATAGYLLVCWGILRGVKFLPRWLSHTMPLVILVVVFTTEATQASIVMLRNALSKASYIAETKSTIANYLTQTNTLRRIHFVIPHNSSLPYDRFFLANVVLTELLAPESYKLKWCSTPRGQQEQDQQLAIQNCVLQLKPNEIAITYSYSPTNVIKTADMLLVEDQYKDIQLNV